MRKPSVKKLKRQPKKQRKVFQRKRKTLKSLSSFRKPKLKPCSLSPVFTSVVTRKRSLQPLKRQTKLTRLSKKRRSLQTLILSVVPKHSTLHKKLGKLLSRVISKLPKSSKPLTGKLFQLVSRNVSLRQKSNAKTTTALSKIS